MMEGYEKGLLYHNIITSKERQQKYRDKIKQDPLKYALYKEKNRLRLKEKPVEGEERSDSESVTHCVGESKSSDQSGDESNDESDDRSSETKSEDSESDAALSRVVKCLKIILLKFVKHLLKIHRSYAIFMYVVRIYYMASLVVILIH